MKRDDIEYLLHGIANLTGIPVRIYRGRELIYFYSVQSLPADPIKPYIHDVLLMNGSVSYYTTPHLSYYGRVHSGSLTAVLGPSRMTPMNGKDIRDLAFECELPAEKLEEFSTAMRGLTIMPQEGILQLLCTLNFMLNGQKLTPRDISLYERAQLNTPLPIEKKQTSNGLDNDGGVSGLQHNTLVYENTLLGMISKGDSQGLKKWLRNVPRMQGGIIGNDTIRHMKNTFIVTATLAARAAIKGGLDEESAFSLSDDYIKNCELLYAADGIMRLQRNMVLDYTGRVERIRIGHSPSKLLMKVSSYVQENLRSPISIEKLAAAIYISRTHLAARFKRESGMTLTEFILKEKTEEAKRLLMYTDKSLASIGQHLGFSSQSHFTKAFKKYAGKTPRAFREELPQG